MSEINIPDMSGWMFRKGEIRKVHFIELLADGDVMSLEDDGERFCVPSSTAIYGSRERLEAVIEEQLKKVDRNENRYRGPAHVQDPRIGQEVWFYLSCGTTGSVKYQSRSGDGKINVTQSVGDHRPDVCLPADTKLFETREDLLVALSLGLKELYRHEE